MKMILMLLVLISSLAANAGTVKDINDYFAIYTSLKVEFQDNYKTPDSYKRLEELFFNQYLDCVHRYRRKLDDMNIKVVLFGNNSYRDFPVIIFDRVTEIGEKEGVLYFNTYNSGTTDYCINVFEKRIYDKK